MSAAPQPLHRHALAGCRPQPLSSYLKAVAVLRIVAEQADPEARGRWVGERFELITTLDERSLLDFFLTRANGGIVSSLAEFRPAT